MVRMHCTGASTSGLGRTWRRRIESGYWSGRYVYGLEDAMPMFGGETAGEPGCSLECSICILERWARRICRQEDKLLLLRVSPAMRPICCLTVRPRLELILDAVREVVFIQAGVRIVVPKFNSRYFRQCVHLLCNSQGLLSHALKQLSLMNSKAFFSINSPSSNLPHDVPEGLSQPPVCPSFLEGAARRQHHWRLHVPLSAHAKHCTAPTC